jgi:hypothetical protein
MLILVREQPPEEGVVFSTWDRYPAAATRWLRQATHRHRDPMTEFLLSIDVMIYAAGAGLLACLIAIAFA